MNSLVIVDQMLPWLLSLFGLVLPVRHNTKAVAGPQSGVTPDPADYTRYSSNLLRWVVLATTYFLLILFLIGLFDLGLGLYQLIVTGEYTDPAAVVDLIDGVLLLLIVLEVHRTLIAYSKDDPVLPIIVSAAIIAIARQVISFRVDEFGPNEDVLAAALGLSALLLALVLVFVVVQWKTMTDGFSLSSQGE